MDIVASSFHLQQPREREREERKEKKENRSKL
jgi:hypothetical protein